MTKPETAALPVNLLKTHAETHPDKPIAIGLERTITWGELYRNARVLAKGLFGLGLRPGDRAALMCYNLPEVYEVSQALAQIGVTPIRVGYRMKAPEIEYIVENSEAKCIFFYHELADRIIPNKEKYKNVLPAGFVSIGQPAVEGAIRFDDLAHDPPDVDLENLPAPSGPSLSMIYTSGTTGRPKGAARQELSASAGSMELITSMIELLKLGPDEVHLVCCPLYHSAPFLFAGITFVLGGTLVLQPKFDAEEFFQLVEKHGVTSTHMVPTQLKSLLEVPEELTENLNLSSLRSLVCGAAPLFPKTKLDMLDRFGPVLFEYYGSTETSINTFIGPEEIRSRPASVGKSFADNELKIFDASGNEAPDGARGELYVHNSFMMDGYFKNESATGAVHKGKYITAGDIAVRDRDGYYYIVDRSKDMIIRGGVNIYPAEIEEVLSSIPGVRDVAVVGKPDDHWGEIVTAFIVREPGSEIKAESIIDYCEKQMANHKVPVEFYFRDEIPRTPTGKILKKDLRTLSRTFL